MLRSFFFSFQFQDILRPNYNSVDLTEVELTDTADSEARGNDTELLFVRLQFTFCFTLNYFSDNYAKLPTENKLDTDDINPSPNPIFIY